jgi:hypothetical protein
LLRYVYHALKRSAVEVLSTVPRIWWRSEKTMVGVSPVAGSILDLKDTTMETTGHVLLFHVTIQPLKQRQQHCGGAGLSKLAAVASERRSSA